MNTFLKKVSLSALLTMLVFSTVIMPVAPAFAQEGTAKDQVVDSSTAPAEVEKEPVVEPAPNVPSDNGDETEEGTEGNDAPNSGDEEKTAGKNSGAASFTTQNVAPLSDFPAVPEGLEWKAADDGELFNCGVTTDLQILHPQWDAVTDAVSYEYNSYKDGTPGLVGEVLTTNEFVNSWMPTEEGTYEFEVQAVNAGGEKSGWSPRCEITLTNTPVVTETPEITNVDAYYVVSGYKGIGVDISVDKLTDATEVEVRVTRSNGGDVVKTSKVTGSVPGILSTGNPATVTAPIVIQQGSYNEAGSSSWNQPTATWDSTTVPETITVSITRENGPTLVRTINISEVGGPFGTLNDVMPLPACSSDDTTFDTFTNGNVDGQNGWGMTGSYDVEVVDNTYGIDSFGCKSLRISNAVTTGAFGNQTFSYSTPNEAGEIDSTNGGMSGGTRVDHYEAEFDIASTTSSEQPGLAISISPDRGDGSRMSYLGFADTSSGIAVTFYDTPGETSPANFNATSLGNISREAHTIKFVIDYMDGPSNDVVKIYIDGALVHTGTTWENYYRFDNEANAEQTPRTSDSLIFRSAGTAVAGNSGNGFLIDNVNITTSSSTIDDDTAPSIPALIFPADQQTLNTNNLYIDWEVSTDDVTAEENIRYEYRLFLENPELNPSAIIRYQKDYVGTTRHPAAGFAAGTPEDTYFWRVQACDEADNCSGWSPVREFTVDNDPSDDEEPIEYPFGEITSPANDYDVVSGETTLLAMYDDNTPADTDGVQWAVRIGSCSGAANNIYGNVNGMIDVATWDNENFSFTFDTGELSAGEYCFVFNPTDDLGETDVRETRWFVVEEATVDSEPDTDNVPALDGNPSARSTSRRASFGGSTSTGSIGGQVLGAESYNFTLLLKRGSTGTEVMELQKFLNAAGYNSGVEDGIFGPITEAAVKAFQAANGLVADGIVGPLTRAVLNA